MPDDVTSRHLRNAHELLLRIPIKRGFVAVDSTLSYASRLRLLLSTLYKLRVVLAERDLGYIAGPIERLQTLWNSQWTVLPDDRHLLVTVSFDRSWEEYFQRLVFDSGPALDLIFQHCEDYGPNSCVSGDGSLRYQGFAHWIRRHQIPCEFYYAGAPDLTVDDLVYLRKLAALREPRADAAAQLRVHTPEREARELEATLDPERAAAHREASARAALEVFGLLRDTFPEKPEQDGEDAPSARLVFDRGVRNLVPELPSPARVAADDPLATWIATLRELPGFGLPATRRVQLDASALDSIQGNVLTGYRRMTHGACVLVSCDGVQEAKAFLRAMADRVTSETQSQATQGQGGPFLNVALTLHGLRRLGPGDDVLQALPKEFREGMDARAGSLGDVGEPNHPAHWRLPRKNWQGQDEPLSTSAAAPRVELSSVDFVVTVQLRSDAGHDWLKHPLREAVAQLETLGARILHVQLLRRADSEVVYEHFGFADGLSQPVPNAALPKGSLTAATQEEDIVALGEFLLGYTDARGEIAWCADAARNPTSRTLFRNGSFVVIRKLEQDVAAFRDFARYNAGSEDHREGEALMAATVGREKHGEPLVDPSAKGNFFDYRNDPEGRKCPLHAHIRRANPRADLGGGRVAPRILRRGFSYGRRYDEAPHDSERGLLFVAYNASLASQFEVIQRWLNGGNVTGVLSAQNDLFTGAPQPAPGPHWVYREGRWTALTPPPRPLVSLRWGLYAFAPSREALRWLADRAGTRHPDAGAEQARLARGEEILQSSLALQERDEAAARDALRSVIEEPTRTLDAHALWSAVRARGGVVKTAYATLVGTPRAATAVLGDRGARFSVREYWHRLTRTTGEHYLSFDPEPAALAQDASAKDASAKGGDASRKHPSRKDAAYEARLREPTISYAQRSAAPNAFLLENFAPGAALGPEATLKFAQELAAQVLDGAMHDRPRGRILLRTFAALVAAGLSRRWFGLPNLPHDARPEALLAGMLPIVRASQFSFQPYPGEVLLESFDNERARAAAALKTAGKCEFGDFLEGQSCDPAEIHKALVGAAVGFCAPAIGCALSVLHQWLASRELWAIADRWNATTDPRALSSAVVESLLRGPVPPLLYRTATGTALEHVRVERGSVAVVGLGAVAQADDGNWDWLFGGSRETNPHACPARHAAIAAISGMIAALLERRDIEDLGGLRVAFGRSLARTIHEGVR